MAIYVVTGHPRSGTSLMMRMLHLGGIPVAYTEERDLNMQAKFTQASGFNPYGLYELSRNKLTSADFPSSYEGMAVKLVWEWLMFMTPYTPGYRVIAMWRNPEEVRQSYEATILQHQNRKTRVDEAYRARWPKIIERLQSREDVWQVIKVNYNHVIEDPLRECVRLKHLGIPIDVAGAESAVDADLYRFRLDDTIVRGA